MANCMIILSMIKGKSSHKLDVTTDANKRQQNTSNKGNETEPTKAGTRKATLEPDTG